MKAQSNPFSTFEAFQTAQKHVIGYICHRFPSLSIFQVEDLVAEAFVVAHTFEEAEKLTLPIIAFAKKIARNKAIDKIRHQNSLYQRGISFVGEACALQLCAYTEGGILGDADDELMQFLIHETTAFIKKQNAEMQQVFEAYGDSQLSQMTDVELAKHFNFKRQTGTAVRKKRCDLKRKLKEHLTGTPQYEHALQVVYGFSLD